MTLHVLSGMDTNAQLSGSCSPRFRKVDFVSYLYK
jgi:hypothetical protein